ncbi:MAG: 23S rRNA (adenine(2503)-C(2))-methyltransferase RlmN [Anaerolineales bacterium]|nr:23S rRNA (adenine(2503)-C(2))-methyltransferase RlmN [Anaerolineales bacterium]
MILPCVHDITEEELLGFLAKIGEPPYRAKQIRRNLYSGLIDDPDRMTDLPAGLRAVLKRSFLFQPLVLDQQAVSGDRQTRKYLFHLPDGAPMETVLMLYDRRKTACISTQSGCSVGCAFCATGQMGLRRSLTGGEISAQVFYLERMLKADGRGLTNIVVMGMGEPFLNYEAFLSAVRQLTAADGFGFGARRITVSTVGIVPGIRRFAGEHSQVNLAVSLHAADDDLRSRLIPVNRTYPLADLFAACDEYIRETNRRLSLEWALIDGVNDSTAQAHRLADRIRKQLSKPLVHINLIPLNPTRRYPGSPANTERIEAFRGVLAEEGLACTVRLARGVDIAAGCGQLAGSVDAVSPKRPSG